MITIRNLDYQLLHQRFGHAYYQRILQMSKLGIYWARALQMLHWLTYRLLKVFRTCKYDFIESVFYV